MADNMLQSLLFSGGGSGGGGSDSSELMVVKITAVDSAGETTYTFSHTPAEVYSWITANKPAIAIMDGVIGKVYLGNGIDADREVICAIPKYNGMFITGGYTRSSDGLTAVGHEIGTEWEWSTNYSRRMFGADEVISGSFQGKDGYAIIWSEQNIAPYYQPINEYYTFDGALSQLVTGAMLAASPEAALSTVLESTAPEFGGLVDTIKSIYESFVGRSRGVIVQGIADQDNRDSWLVKNVTGDNSVIYITADACFTTFSNSSPSSVSMVTLTIVGLTNASHEPEKIAVTVICKNISTTVV